MWNLRSKRDEHTGGRKIKKVKKKKQAKHKTLKETELKADGGRWVGDGQDG